METRFDASAPAGTRRIPNFRLRSTPERLLAAALEEFASQRFDTVRVENVTRRLGLTKSALYAHFPTKRALFDGVIEQFCLPDDFVQVKEQALAAALAADPARRVLQIVLREWPSTPEIGLRYLDAVVAKVTSRAAAPDADAARRMVRSALLPVMMDLLFSLPAATDGATEHVYE